MSEVLEVPSSIKVINRVDYSEVEESLYNNFVKELVNYCKEKSSCPDAGEIVVFYSDENSDSQFNYGAVYIIFDYDNIYSVDGDSGSILKKGETDLMNEESILLTLSAQRSDLQRMLDSEQVPF